MHIDLDMEEDWGLELLFRIEQPHSESQIQSNPSRPIEDDLMEIPHEKVKYLCNLMRPFLKTMCDSDVRRESERCPCCL